MLNTTTWRPAEFRPLLQGVLYTFTSIDVASSDAETSTWTFPKHELARIVAECIKEVAEVQSICAGFGDGENVIWTLLEAYDRDAREKVYEKELSICQMVHLYDFDFRVTSVDLVSPSELVDTGLQEIYRRK